MNERCDVAVVGAGAAGLAAAIFAAEAARARGTQARILVLDGAEKVGTKILISGGGRCNVTHDAIVVADFNGTPHVVRHVLAQFGAADAVRWFASLGVKLKRESTGKLFPVTDSARTVLNALLDRCRELSVCVLTGRRVRDVVALAEAVPGCPGPAFEVVLSDGRLRARRVVMATGGRSLPRTGSDGAGLGVVEQLGHSITPCYPALVPLVLDPEMFHAQLSGLSHEVELSVLVDGRLADRRTGSLLWTHFGVSGPVVLDASRHCTVARGAGRTAEIRCNSMPGRDFADVDGWLQKQADASPRRLVATLLRDELPARLAAALVTHAGIEPATSLGRLTRDARRQLGHALTSLPLPVVRERGWNYAEVTAGGVPLNEVDFRTMQSRRQPGLYLVGELLDCDGRIGGFNFQWAWSTGYVAGHAVAASLGED